MSQFYAQFNGYIGGQSLRYLQKILGTRYWNTRNFCELATKRQLIWRESHQNFL